MSRADEDPAQAETDMERLNRAAEVAESHRDDAQERVDQLERDLDAATDGDAMARVQAEHAQAEQALSGAEADYQSALDQVGNAQSFWFED